MRALRHRRGWRQIDLALAAGCSQNLVSLVERGHLDRLSVRTVRRLVGALDATVFLELRWRGAALDRLADEAHATLVGFVADYLRARGWLVELEVTYSEYGERGSYDLLAFHPGSRSLLVIEVKTDLPSVEGTLRKLDEKERLASKVARDRFAWRPTSVSRLLVMPASPTLRRRMARHSAVIGASVPTRTVAARRWLGAPTGRLAGVWFVSHRDGGVGVARARSPERVRKPNSGRNNPRVAA